MEKIIYGNEGGAFETACAEAIKQIADRGYDASLLMDGMDTVIRYGIACFKKRCKVLIG